jgi:DNA-binding transcriptional LysR family regulator
VAVSFEPAPAISVAPRSRQMRAQMSRTARCSAAGQGVSLIPRLGLPDNPPAVTLTALTARRRIGIACRKGTRQHPVVSAFAAAIRQSAANP